MIIDLTFRHLNHTPALDELIEQKLQKLSKFFTATARLKCNCWIEGEEQICTLAIHDHHKDYYAKAESADLYKTIDLAIKKLERQIQANLPEQHLHSKHHIAEDVLE